MKVERIGALRVMVSIVFLSIAFYLLTGLFGQPLGGARIVFTAESSKRELCRLNDGIRKQYCYER